MAAEDQGKGKNTGESYSGESPQSFGNLKTASNESLGQHQMGPNEPLKQEGGGGDYGKGPAISTLDPMAKGYKGPENWAPENKGDVGTYSPK